MLIQNERKEKSTHAEMYFCLCIISYTHTHNHTQAYTHTHTHTHKTLDNKYDLLFGTLVSESRR